MIYTFRSPWSAEVTSNVIIGTIQSMQGSVKIDRPGCFRATWKTQPYHSQQYHTVFPTQFTFYVGDGVVRAVTGTETMQALPVRYYRLAGTNVIWNAFIESLLRLVPGGNFGIKPGVPEMVAIQFFGDGTEQVLVSRTKNSPSLGGAALGGLLFGPAGALIGASAGTSHTTGRTSTRFSDEILAKALYSNGLVAEGVLSRKSPQYHAIMANMSRLSNGIVPR